MQVHMGPDSLGARRAEGELFNWNKGTNIEPCTGPSLSDNLSEFSARVRPEHVSFFLSSHYTAPVAARACERGA